MSKATHKGSCQVCGREQKLPSGRLSLHGYTTKWGFFSGTCPGSGFSPFEESKDLIEGAIAYAKNKAAILQAQVDELLKPAQSPHATCYVYRGTSECRGREKPGYEWVTGPIEKREPRYGFTFVVIAEDGREYYVASEGQRNSELLAATYNNRRYAKALTAQISQLEEYISWQESRIQNWAPQPLMPV